MWCAYDTWHVHGVYTHAMCAPCGVHAHVTHMHVHTFMHMGYTCMYIHSCTWDTHACTNIYSCACDTHARLSHAHQCMCMCRMRIHACVSHAHECTYIYMHAHTYIHSCCARVTHILIRTYIPVHVTHMHVHTFMYTTYMWYMVQCNL
jgi:hypothetical protein